MGAESIGSFPPELLNYLVPILPKSWHGIQVCSSN